jgi:hypothetical protein
MTSEEVKVYLEYTKVLLAINKIDDSKVNTALDIAIDSFGEDQSDEIYMNYKLKGK